MNAKTTPILAGALTATMALAGCWGEEEKSPDTDTNATLTEAAETTLEVQAPAGSSSVDTSVLVTLKDVPLTRNGVEFTADIRGGCFDYSLEKSGMTCENFLTALVQDAAQTENFFTNTNAKLSTMPAFIKAGLQSRPDLHDAEVNKRLAAVEKNVTRHLKGNDTFYIIDNISDLATADAPLLTQE